MNHATVFPCGLALGFSRCQALKIAPSMANRTDLPRTEMPGTNRGRQNPGRAVKPAITSLIFVMKPGSIADETLAQRSQPVFYSHPNAME